MFTCFVLHMYVHIIVYVGLCRCIRVYGACIRIEITYTYTYMYTFMSVYLWIHTREHANMYEAYLTLHLVTLAF